MPIVGHSDPIDAFRRVTDQLNGNPRRIRVECVPNKFRDCANYVILVREIANVIIGSFESKGFHLARVPRP